MKKQTTIETYIIYQLNEKQRLFLSMGIKERSLIFGKYEKTITRILKNSLYNESDRFLLNTLASVVRLELYNTK